MASTITDPETRPSHSERKRQDIVEAAISAFQEQGFQNASMDRIAALAGVSKRTVYNHFDSKEALFEHINGCLYQQILRAGDLRYDPRRALEEQLRQIAGEEVATLTSPRFIALARCALSAYFHCTELAARSWERVQQSEKGLVRWLRDASADGRLAVDDPRTAARQFSALLKEFLFWPQVLFGAPAPAAAERKRVIDDTVRLLLSRYRV